MGGMWDWLKGLLGMKGKAPAQPAAQSPVKQKKPRPRSGQLGNQTPAQMRELRARKAMEGKKGSEAASAGCEYERLSASLGEKWQEMFGGQEGSGGAKRGADVGLRGQPPVGRVFGGLLRNILAR